MNTSFSLLGQKSAIRSIAIITIFSLLLSALPAAFFVAQAAPQDLYSTTSVTVEVSSPFSSSVINASNHSEITLSFNYDSTELDGPSDGPDSFTYGWRIAGSSNNDLGTVQGEVGSTGVEISSIGPIPLPVAAQVANLEIYVNVTAVPGGDTDQVRITNLLVSGKPIPPPLPPLPPPPPPVLVLPPVTPDCESTDTVADTTFDTFSTGNVNGQKNWNSTGPFDQEIVENTYGFTSFGCKSLRVSNAVTSGSFGDQTFAAPIANSVGEIGATVGTFTEGTRFNRFEVEFDIASTKPTAQQSGLALSVSPDRGDGSRMSFLRFTDVTDGIEVTFFDVQGAAPGAFTPTVLGIFDRTKSHTIKFLMDMKDGPDNDVVQIFINGELEHTGGSWENYYRNNPEASAEPSPRIMKTLLIRSSGTAAPATNDGGFLFDNLSLKASNTPVQPDTAPVVTIENPTPTENSSVRGVVSGRALATDDKGMGSYFLRYWKDAFEVAGGGTLVGGCQEALGADLLGKTLDKSCEFDTTTRPDGMYFFSAQFLDSNNQWGSALRKFTVDNTPPTAPTGLTWTGSDNVLVPHNGTTSLPAGTAGWQRNTETDFSHYLYKYWNNIPTSQYKSVGTAWVSQINGVANTSLPGEFNQGEGTHYFCIAAVDRAGNESACSSTFTINYSLAIPTATVTLCKDNQYGEKQSGWQLALLGEVVDTIAVPSTGVTVSSKSLIPGPYVIKANGTYIYRTGPDMQADAAFSLRRANEISATSFVNGLWLPSTHWGADSWLSLRVNDGAHSFGTVFSPDHTYFASLNLLTTGVVTFNITDTGYTDNSGALTATVYKGFAGVTAANGCVVFENVPYGSYTTEEQKQVGWVNTQGLGAVSINSPTHRFTVTNRDESIIEGCTNPNAGNFNPNATRDNGSCTLAIPVHLSPANGTTTTSNDFFFDWTDVVGAVGYEVQFSQSTVVGTDGGLTSGVWQGDFQGTQPTTSQARSVGASGTWYWQVRTVDDSGARGVWTTPWMVTISNTPVVVTPPVVITSTTTPTTTVPVVPLVPSTSSNRGGGTLIPSLTRSGLQPLVLGASTMQCGMLIKDYLRAGQPNNEFEVKKLQWFLISQGYFIPVTGVFDLATEIAVRSFQEAHRADILTPWVTAGILKTSNPSGWVYQLTRWKINNIICPGSEPLPTLLP